MLITSINTYIAYYLTSSLLLAILFLFETYLKFELNVLNYIQDIYISVYGTTRRDMCGPSGFR